METLIATPPPSEERNLDTFQEPPGAPKKKRLLSDKQKAALELGREKRRKQMGLIEAPTPPPSHEEKYASQEPLSETSDSNSDSFLDSSTDEEIRRKRKERSLKKRTPKPIRRCLDRYIKKK